MGTYLEIVRQPLKCESEEKFAVLGHERQNNRRSRSVPPVSHQLTDDGEEGEDVDTSLPHALVGVRSGLLASGARSVGIGKDLVASLDEREGEEGGTDLR